MYPQNEMLWNSLKRQASAMYPNHGTMGKMSPAAAKWLHDRYANSGGSQVGSRSEVPRQFQDVYQRQLDKKKKNQEGNLGAYTSKAGSGL